MTLSHHVEGTPLLRILSRPKRLLLFSKPKTGSNGTGRPQGLPDTILKSRTNRVATTSNVLTDLFSRVPSVSPRQSPTFPTTTHIHNSVWDLKSSSVLLRLRTHTRRHDLSLESHQSSVMSRSWTLDSNLVCVYLFVYRLSPSRQTHPSRISWERSTSGPSTGVDM